jgi:hypothetical protein
MKTCATDKLALLISKKLQVLVQLRDVGQKQLANIDQGETMALLKLLAAKQHLITGLQAVERELSPFRDDDPDRREWRSVDDRARCADQAAKCNELLQEILHMEKESEERMTRRRNAAAAQLQQAHAASRAHGAYASQRRTAVWDAAACVDDAPDSVRLDLVSEV